MKHTYMTKTGRKLALSLTLGLCATGLALAAGGPLFYYTELASFEGGGTTAAKINAAGQIAGVSGSFSTQTGMDPFLSDRSGALTNLNSLDYVISNVGALNEHGAVAGTGSRYFGNNTWSNSIFRYTPENGMQDLGKFSGYSGTVMAMNNHGALVGAWSISETTYMPYSFLYTDADGLRTLGTLGGNRSIAMDINDAGQVVGTASTALGQDRAFLWQNNQIFNLGTLGGVSSQGVAINEAGTIIGDTYQNTGGWQPVPFIYTPTDGMRALPAPAGAAYHYAQLLNEADMVAGTWVPKEGFQQRIYRYTSTEGAVDIGALPDMIGMQLTGMNNHGHIVGLSMNMMYESTAFLWTPETGMIDLKPLLSPALDWFQLQPVAINDAGLILLTGWDEQGLEHSAVLWPQHPGDLNCDGVMDFFDIDPFILALTDPAAYEANYPGCEIRNADVNRDGTLDFFDIDSFMELML